MTHAPRVTVAVPTRDRPELLARALDSVRAQTIDDWEVVVSDNSSDGRTAEMMERYADEPRITYAPNAENIGPFRNFTRCLGLGTAPVVGLLQDDDELTPDSLERRLALLDEHPDVVVAHSAFSFADPDGADLGGHVRFWGPFDEPVEPSDVFLRRTMGAGARILLSAALLRRSATEGLAFLAEDAHCTDLGMWLRMGRRGGVAFLDEPLVVCRVHPESETVSSGKYRWTGDEYVPSLDAVAVLDGVKRRFLAEHPDVDPTGELAAAADGYRRRQALRAARAAAGPRPSPRALWRSLGDAEVVQPGLRREPRVLREVAAAAVPSPVRRLLGR